MDHETTDHIGEHPINPLIDQQSPGDTLANCSDVLAFVGRHVVGEDRQELTVGTDEAAGLWRVLEVVRAALAYESEQMPHDRRLLETLRPRAVNE